MRLRHISELCLILVLAGLVGGCVSSTSGSSTLTADNVKQIKKGVTTGAEVEAIFGPPETVQMLSDGKRAMQYYFTESDMHSDWETYVPIVQLFAAKAEGQTTTRSLQVILDGNDVVQDYQYNDSTNNVEVGTFSSKTTPVSNPSSGN